MIGVILYGPPASGKDTVSAALTEAEPRCQLFKRLKAGSGKTSTYRMTTMQHIADLRARGDVAWENARYDAVYVVDTPHLLERLAHGVPVLHLGQPEAVAAVKRATPGARWLVVSLWCNREATEQRLRRRNPADVSERLRVWDETTNLGDADLELDTSILTPPAAAGTILRALDQVDPSRTGAETPTPRIIVPVLTLKNRDGTLDIPANVEYAERAAATWIHGFIIAGTIGEGDRLSRDARERILGIWQNRVGPTRLFGTAWSLTDTRWIATTGSQTLAVMRNLHDDSEALDYLSQLPSDSYVYSHPNYTSATFDQGLAIRAIEVGKLPAGGKLCKISLTDVTAMRSTAGPSFGLYDGRCRHISRSMAAGATGVIAAPLATLPELPAEPNDISGLQDVINLGQARMDADTDRRSRLARLSAECRRLLHRAPEERAGRA